EGHGAVGGAARAGDDVVFLGVVALVVHTHHDRVVLVGRRRGDDDLLGSALVDVDPGFASVREQAGGLDDDVHIELLPGQLGRVFVAHELHVVPVDDDVIALGRDGWFEGAECGVVLEQVGEGVGVADVVDGHDFERRLQRVGRAVDVPADAAKTVDPNPGHIDTPSNKCRAGRPPVVVEACGSGLNVRRSDVRALANAPRSCGRRSPGVAAGGD